MAAKFRNLIAARSMDIFHSLNLRFDGDSRVMASKLRLYYNRNSDSVGLKIRINELGLSHQNNEEIISRFLGCFTPGDGVAGAQVDPAGTYLSFPLHTRDWMGQVLKTTLIRERSYAWSRNALFNGAGGEDQKIVVEFSSPNIAKPFHVGHFRSTILGNYVANIQEAVGHQVTRLNYLGDWGTQFGLLLAGLETTGTTMEKVRIDPIGVLLSVYVEANKKAEEDSLFSNQAREAFNRLENGDQSAIEIWRQCRQFTIEELGRTYDKLAIRFDHFDGESMYGSDRTDQVINLLSDAGLLETTEDGRQVVELGGKNRVTIVKSDGSSLYISRDIAAVIDRRKRFNFDKLLYVVDGAQQHHFSNLFSILGRLKLDWASTCQHVKFGKILGISTRKGSMVYLSDLIDEARDIMLESQDKSPNTRVDVRESAEYAEKVAISALIINDLKQRRTKDYKFSWDRALSHNGDTGVKLQYSYARLSSLLANCQDLITSPDNIQPDNLPRELVYHLGRWDEVLAASYFSLEPHIIVSYLFSLVNLTNKALASLPVKKAASAGDLITAQSRLILFSATRQVLGQGLELLGIQPLEQM